MSFVALFWFWLKLPIGATRAKKGCGLGFPKGKNRPPSAHWGARAPQPQSRESSEPGAVLVVEDEPLNRRLLAILLDSVGLRFHLAANGQEALDLFSAEPYGLVFMDCMMLVMNGFETTQGILKLARKSELPAPFVVAYTAYLSDEVTARAQASGMVDVLGKPIDLQVVTKKLTLWRDEGRWQSAWTQPQPKPS